MGGRGTFAAGKSVPFSYKEVDSIHGVKVLQGINGKHSLPESAHSSRAYIKLDKDKNFYEMRVYDKNKCLKLEIAYHIEEKLTGNRTASVLHYHTYDSAFSKTKGPFYRSEAKKITPGLYKKYKKFFKGVKND